LNQATETNKRMKKKREKKIKEKMNVPTHNGPKGDRNLINAR